MVEKRKKSKTVLMNGIEKYLSAGIVSKMIVVLWCMFLIFAIGWIFLASVSSARDITQGQLLATGFYFENFTNIIEKYHILQYYGNSLLYTTTACIGLILLGAPASYALANYRFRGRKIIQTAYASSMGLPAIMLMIPMFVMLSGLKLANNTVMFILIYICISMPFTIFYLSGFFASKPKEIQESALTEGCTHIKAFWMVVFPTAQPGIITVTIFNFIGLWNEYMWASIFVNSGNTRPLSLGLKAILESMRLKSDWGALMAAVVLVFVPTFVLYIFLAERIMVGMTSGAVKG